MTSPTPIRRGAPLPRSLETEQGYGLNQSWWNYWGGDDPTPELQWPQNVMVYDTMLKQDAQIRSVVRAVTMPVAQARWRIRPKNAPDDVVNFVSQNLGLPIVGQTDEPLPVPRERDRFSWSQHVEWALKCAPYGHMFFEQVYRLEGNRAYLRKLAPRWHKTLQAINVATDGGLVSIEQKAVPRPGMRTWAQTIDRNGMGVPHYTASEEEDSLDAGTKLAQSYRSGSAAGGAGPNGSRMELLGVQGALPNIDAFVRYQDELIARAVLAHFMNLGQAQGTGSFALGASFMDFFIMSLEGLAKLVATTATHHVVEDLVDLNFGPDVPAPEIVNDPIGQNPTGIVTAVQALIAAGAIFPDPALDAFVRQVVGLPPKAPLPGANTPVGAAEPPPGV
jgi:hypothetical protein